jgi:hypothetical protein
MLKKQDGAALFFQRRKTTRPRRVKSLPGLQFSKAAQRYSFWRFLQQEARKNAFFKTICTHFIFLHFFCTKIGKYPELLPCFLPCAATVRCPAHFFLFRVLLSCLRAF